MVTKEGKVVLDTPDGAYCIVGTYGAGPFPGDPRGGRWHIGRALLDGVPGAVIYHKMNEADEWETVAVLPERVVRYAIEVMVDQVTFPLIPPAGEPLTAAQADALRFSDERARESAQQAWDTVRKLQGAGYR